MIYKFKSKASGDVIMLGPNGDALLRAIGREPAANGIIEVAAMAAARSAIEAAVLAQEAAQAQARSDAQAAGQEAPGENAAVSLRARWWPMVDMLKRAHAAQQPIVWGV